jgi:hypothetical protein
MALRAANQVKTVIGAQKLQLTAKPGESLLIKDIRIANPEDTYLTLKVDKTTVGYFRTAGDLGNHLFWLPGITKPVRNVDGHRHKSLTFNAIDGVRDIAAGDDMQRIRSGNGDLTPLEVCTGGPTSGPKTLDILTSFETIPITSFPTPQPLMPNLLGWLIQKGYMKGYPVAEGETFLVEWAPVGRTIQMVIYDVYDAGDIKPTDPNGSKADEYVFVQYGKLKTVGFTTGNYKYEVCQTPPEFPDFPFEGVVPANTKMELLGILFSDVFAYRAAPAERWRTTYIKMVYQRQVLFDEDRNGLPFIGYQGPFIAYDIIIGAGYSVGGNMSDVDLRLPFQTPEPLTFVAGDELSVYLVVEGTGESVPVTTDMLEIGMIFKVSRVKPS